MTRARAEAEENTKSVAVSRGPFVIPGFRVAAAASGMRYSDRTDVALIVSDAPEGAVASGVFTKNRFTAAPVVLCKERLEAHRAGAILVNAGIANACTGDEGLARARETSAAAAEALEIQPDAVLVASTGVIGMQLKTESIRDVVSQLVEKLIPAGWGDVARAIMTTDTVPKMTSAQVDIAGARITIGGVAKGSGMIAPNMATMLAFVCTDAAIESHVLDFYVRQGSERTFNAITVDGDTSTNDTLLVLAGGAAGNPVLSDVDSEESRAFGEALEAVFLDLAKRLVVDGEGATKLIEVVVEEAPDPASAKTIALTIANSPLVKTAFFGEDANWGRIVCAAGRSGVMLNPETASLYFDDVCVFKDGRPLAGPDLEERASAVFRQKEIRVRLVLGMGAHEYTAYTCDFSFDYVKINASYRS